MDMTCAIIKPDAVGNGDEGAVLAVALHAGFRVAALRRGAVAEGTWRRFYTEHKGRPFFPGLVSFMASGPVVVLALEREHAVSEWRRVLGATDPRVAFPDTVRGLFGDKAPDAPVWRNAAHGSALRADAKRELTFWFTARELDPSRVVAERNALDEPPMGGLRSMDLGDLGPVAQLLNERFPNEHYAGEELAPVLLRKLVELAARRSGAADPMAEAAVQWDARHCYRCGAAGLGCGEGAERTESLVMVPRYLARCMYELGCRERVSARGTGGSPTNVNPACPTCLGVLLADPLRHFGECAKRAPLPPGHPRAAEPADPDAPRRWRIAAPGAPARRGVYFPRTDTLVDDVGSAMPDMHLDDPRLEWLDGAPGAESR